MTKWKRMHDEKYRVQESEHTSTNGLTQTWTRTFTALPYTLNNKYLFRLHKRWHA